MAEKLIPGIPYSTRIAILQQTDSEIDGLADSMRASSVSDSGGGGGRTVLQQVMASDDLRNDVMRKIDGLYAQSLVDSVVDLGWHPSSLQQRRTGRSARAGSVNQKAPP
jgi:hypothetical protein